MGGCSSPPPPAPWTPTHTPIRLASYPPLCLLGHQVLTVCTALSATPFFSLTNTQFKRHQCAASQLVVNPGSSRALRQVGMSGQASTNELNNVRKIGTENGGVMCCKN